MAFTLHDLLRHLVHIRASDLLLKAGQPPLFRLHGDLLPLHAPALSAEEVEELAQHILRPDQRERFEREREMTVTYQLKNVARYRVTLLQQQGGPSLSVRAIPLHPPSLEELNLPPLCREFCERPQGLILVTGPAGSGKSTTLAALVHHLNSTRALHILTIEEPIEFVHQDLKSFLSQREVGEDTPSFAAALRQALHQDADVILVSELRELEAISLALAAAETGHLVLAALPATDAVQTIERIVEVFPLPQQQRIRLQLAANLVGIISQMLLKRADGTGQVAAFEVLKVTSPVRRFIREAQTSPISSLLRSGEQGMRTLDQSLAELVAREIITPEEASVAGWDN